MQVKFGNDFWVICESCRFFHGDSNQSNEAVEMKFAWAWLGMRRRPRICAKSLLVLLDFLMGLLVLEWKFRLLDQRNKVSSASINFLERDSFIKIISRSYCWIWSIKKWSLRIKMSIKMVIEEQQKFFPIWIGMVRLVKYPHFADKTLSNSWRVFRCWKNFKKR